jgi:aminopeptidase N
MATPDGATVAGQPEVAAAWFPVNDHPLDKASYSFDVTVPDLYEVVANGVLRNRRRHQGRTSWKWEARDPMASYLATIDIGFWDVDRGRVDRLPVYDAVDSAITGGLRAEIDSSLARQGEILELLSGAFGPYPFDTVGAIVDNQDDLILYLRGAMTLQALRDAVGDDAFWRIIRGWASTKSGGNGTTEEFIALAESVSGQQLDDLFTTWLFTPGKPSLAGLADRATALSTQGGASDAGWWQQAQAQHARGRY